MPAINCFTEYRLGERSVLREGDSFRASGGPFYKLPNGSTAKMAAAGPFRFLRYCERGKRKWIEAYDRQGRFCALALTKTKSSVDLPGFVPRPYHILGKVRTP